METREMSLDELKAHKELGKEREATRDSNVDRMYKIYDKGVLVGSIYAREFEVNQYYSPADRGFYNRLVFLSDVLKYNSRVVAIVRLGEASVEVDESLNHINLLRAHKCVPNKDE